MSFYDGTKLLSIKDINGETPEIFICTSNRNAGKTTYFERLLVNRFIKRGKKFGLIYRFNYELDQVSEKFFKDIGDLFFPDFEMTEKSMANGIYTELFLNDTSCGYALALNNADSLKKNSHLFSDIDAMLFDEFQSETNHYCSDEVKKLISVHTSIARGQGKQVRYVPVYMVSNPVSLINPYYTSLNIASRLDNKTRFLRGDGYVLEQGYNESAGKALKLSAFNRAFASDSYTAYASEAVYLNDSAVFIEKISGASKYLATLRYKGKDFAIREFAENGFLYVDDRPDATFKYKITVTTDDLSPNYVMLRKHDMFISSLRYYFEKGCFRFKDLRCKEALINSLSY